MDIVLRQYIVQEDNKLEKLQQKHRHENGHEHQEYQQVSVQERYHHCKDLLKSVIGSNKSRKCELFCEINNEHKSLDQRKLYEIFHDDTDSILAKQVEKFKPLYLKSNRTLKEFKEMESTKKDISGRSDEREKSYIIKQDDDPTRVKEQQEKIKDLQANNNNSQQTLFKIQASNTNSNEKTKDNNDRQSLVIKLVKIAQQDDKNECETIDEVMEEVASNKEQLIDTNHQLSDSIIQDNSLEETVMVELKNAVNVEEEILLTENDSNDSRFKEVEFATQVEQTIVEKLQTCTNHQVKQEILPELSEQTADALSSNIDQLLNEEHKSPEQEDNNNDDGTSVKNLDQDQDASPAALGRNRRVRQKNRYFSDFHCMNLAKGTRSRDDCDTNASSSGLFSTRTSNRRSTIDSSRSGSQTSTGLVSSANADDEAPPEYELKRCRKCREKTPHDQMTGCQACVYKKIVEKHKGGQQTKSSSAKSKSRSKSRVNVAQSSATPSSSIQKQETDSSSLATDVVGVKTEDVKTTASLASATTLKRKAPDQTGGPTKLVNQSIDDSEEKADRHAETKLNSSPSCEPDTSNPRPKSTSNSAKTSPSRDSEESSPSHFYGSSFSCSEESSPRVSERSTPSSNLGCKQENSGTDAKIAIQPVQDKMDSSELQEQQHHSSIVRAEDELIKEKPKQLVGENKKAEHTYSKLCKRSNSSSPVHDGGSETKLRTKRSESTEDNDNDINRNKNGDENQMEPSLANLDTWSPEQVAEFVLSRGFASEAEQFKIQSIDGISLLLMQRNDFTSGLKMKLGPALKLYDQVCKLKSQYFKDVAMAS